MLLRNRLVRFCARVDNLSREIGRFDNHAITSISQVFLIERSVVQMQIEWELFVRHLILDSATGKFEDRNGTVQSHLSIRVSSREAASHLLISQYGRRRRFEPKWIDTGEVVDAAKLLRLSNESNIALSLGVHPWELDDLRCVRNFIVHRSKSSAIELRSRHFSTLSGPYSAAAIVRSFSSSGVRYYKSWSDFMKTVASNLAN